MSESKTALKKAAKREALTEKRQSHEVHQTAQARSLLGVLRTVAEAVPALSVTLPSLELSKGKGRGAPVDPELAARAEAALSGVASLLRGDSVPYRALPRAFHSQGLDVLATMVHRPSKYQDKFLAQELSLLGKVWAIAGGGGADLAVVDIGAGNGCLALIASLTLDAQAVLVDHTLPREELRVESRIPDEYHQRILRITRDIEDLASTALHLPTAHGTIPPPFHSPHTSVVAVHSTDKTQLNATALGPVSPRMRITSHCITSRFLLRNDNLPVSTVSLLSEQFLVAVKEAPCDHSTEPSRTLNSPSDTAPATIPST